MKKIFTRMMLASLVVVFGCGSDTSDPTQSLKSFLQALEKQDYAEAKKYATDESKSLLDLMAMGNSSNQADSSSSKSSTVERIIFGDPTINGEKATVTVQQKVDQTPVTFTLKKIGNDWKVAFDKTTLLGMGMEQLNEKGSLKKNQLDKALDEIKKVGIDSMQRAYEQEMKQLDTALQSLKDSA
jgi:hypothetical protein